ncbi:murein transglycosylase A [Noviherbaspirillum suwonense]|jgi:membrane-bound lytic murein transglycosylase A|uniref:peptidoglycan lytic exotransglycosylase n=1 Tax=Noviherbaspirillum suwonense TaxID=1224511 RepID=A0ABY1PZ29_9BURK|nr:MltA domain-containing protein [Noviherbaspirillum suwonense]SMP53639.1 membrane-bound lytic murein transglycosylase A [Noviherbaspirillum suwonense]
MSTRRRSLLGSLSLAAAIILAGCSTTPPPPVKSTETAQAPAAAAAPGAAPGPVLRPVAFSSLPGWDRDELRDAWPAFLASCDVMTKRAEWREPCSIARTVDSGNTRAIRTFFEAFFTPQQVFNPDGTDNGLVTGYYEPLLNGARKRGGPYQTPLHRVPDDLLTVDLGGIYPELKNMRLRGRLAGNKVVPYPARAELAQSGALAGSELIWVDNPIDAFFLQVQGSGRVQIADTRETVRVAYADQNGHPYRSIGRYLVDKGELTMDQASAQGIKAWLAANPKRQQELLNANPGYVFFKEEKLVDPRKGPKGALGVPLTPQRSVAVDPNYIPLGAPVFLSTTQPGSNLPLQRMMVAQDTGGAIKNAVRADYFWGFGAEAGEKAGRMKQRGMLWVLLPKLGAGQELSRR